MGKPHPALYGWSVNDLVRICQVDISTARRWKRGAFCPPKTALMMLARDLGCFSDYWKNWTINGEDIVSPEGWCINRNHALSVPLMHGQISVLKVENKKLRRELEQAIASGLTPNQEWEIQVSVGPPGQLRTLRATLREVNDAQPVVLLKLAK